MVIESKGAAEPASLVLNEEDLAYEEEILRNPHAIKVWKLLSILTPRNFYRLFQPWIRYIEHKADSPKNILNMIFERALKELPGSYKLWYNYLKVIQLTPCKFGECDMVGFNQINQIGSEEADEEQSSNRPRIRCSKQLL